MVERPPPRPNEIRRLLGVYAAVGTLRGELAYFVRARIGRAHCGLCDITHGTVRERPEWRRWRDTIGAPFDTYHLDDQPTELRHLEIAAPFIAAEVDETIVVLLDRQGLDRCDGSLVRLDQALRQAATDHGLRWPLSGPDANEATSQA